MALTPLLLLVCVQSPADPDTDRDGLSDFREIHKHFTDPASADSDGDGIPDGDWEERREYAYTVRSVVQVLPPVTPDVLCDDYQDARILEKSEDFVELEVVHFPLNTVADAIAGDGDWRRKAAAMKEWVEPGPTANWDAAMRRDLIAALKKDGIDAAALDDRTLVEKASKWLLQRAPSVDGFSTFCSYFPKGKAAIYPGMEESAEKGKAEKNLTVEQQWERELFARGMFANRVRGSCTSSAIYLNGCLRALGIPTRIVLCIPVVDASDERELAFVREGITHPTVRRTVRQGVQSLGQSWASHTFNEVFVGGRWRRLNYERLGQNILDAQFFGLLTHVATFGDWADGEMAKTWGLRQAGKRKGRDVFGGSNPYSTVSLSDRFGAHSKVQKPTAPDPDDLRRLTIERAMWHGEKGWPESIDLQADDYETTGHLLVRVREDGEFAAFQDFYARVGKEFALRSDQSSEIRANAERGFWLDSNHGVRDFYLRIAPGEFARMVPAIPYRLVPLEPDEEVAWAVADEVVVVRPQPPAPEPGELANVTIDRVVWSDDRSLPSWVRDGFKEEKPVLLAHLVEWDGLEKLKRFQAKADLRFFLETSDRPPIKVMADVGGVSDDRTAVRFAVIRLGPGDWRDLVPGTKYRLRPQNARAAYRWAVADGVRVIREE